MLLLLWKIYVAGKSGRESVFFCVAGNGTFVAEVFVQWSGCEWNLGKG